jgi:hypothetical protein
LVAVVLVRPRLTVAQVYNAVQVVLIVFFLPLLQPVVAVAAVLIKAD